MNLNICFLVHSTCPSQKIQSIVNQAVGLLSLFYLGQTCLLSYKDQFCMDRVEGKLPWKIPTRFENKQKISGRGENLEKTPQLSKKRKSWSTHVFSTCCAQSLFVISKELSLSRRTLIKILRQRNESFLGRRCCLTTYQLSLNCTNK